jgi:hypothetical protein
MVAKPKKIALHVILSFAIVIFIAAVFLIVSILYGRSWSGVTAPPLLGNRPGVISGLTDGQSEPRPFSFLVAGDTRSSSTFENFYKNASLDSTPDFGVILGDFVAYPELSRHRFFMGEFSEWKMAFPVFLIAGNHDAVTKYERRLDRTYDPVYVPEFEKMYGPTNFSFIYRGCLFIGLNDAYRTDYLDYLKEVLARRPPGVLMTFVFIHIPPPSIIASSVVSREMEGEGQFMRLMDDYNVDFVFAGDFHSYFRTDRGHTRYIVTGGGGSSTSGNAARSFHHVLFMTVDPLKDQVDETIYSLRQTLDPWDGVEIVMICGLFPVFEGHPLRWVAVFCLVAVVTGGLVIFLITRIARKKRTPRRLST